MNIKIETLSKYLKKTANNHKTPIRSIIRWQNFKLVREFFKTSVFRAPACLQIQPHIMEWFVDERRLQRKKRKKKTHHEQHPKATMESAMRKVIFLDPRISPSSSHSLWTSLNRVCLPVSHSSHTGAMKFETAKLRQFFANVEARTQSFVLQVIHRIKVLFTLYLTVSVCVSVCENTE